MTTTIRRGRPRIGDAPTESIRLHARIPSRVHAPRNPLQKRSRRQQHMTKKTIITRYTVGTYDTTDRSLRWWHREARRIFASHLGVHTVTIAHGGRKTDLLERGEYVPPPGHYYIIASTGGKWGRPRREFNWEGGESFVKGTGSNE